MTYTIGPTPSTATVPKREPELSPELATQMTTKTPSKCDRIIGTTVRICNKIELTGDKTLDTVVEAVAHPKETAKKIDSAGDKLLDKVFQFFFD